MMKKINHKKWLWVHMGIILVLAFFKLYFMFFDTSFHSLNLTNMKEIQEELSNKETFSFAVVGNIKNSIDIFEKRLIPTIKANKVDFVISTGNAVRDGSEDRYRAIKKTMDKLTIPMVMAVGECETLDGGASRFYQHFGPFYYAFSVGNSYFIFLDTTGETSLLWQKEWLAKELINAQSYQQRFVFMNKPVYEGKEGKAFHTFIEESFAKYNVSAVYASGKEVYKHQTIQGVPYYISGGAGGGIDIGNPDSYYHYLEVKVNPHHISHRVVKQSVDSRLPFAQILKNIWYYIHTGIRTNFIDILLCINIIIFAGGMIVRALTKEINYYGDFDQEVESVPNHVRMNIAMFTNNYFPFIGGVPISIDRLAKGLKQQGHNVFIFAPKYPVEYENDEENIIRCKLLKYLKTKEFNFPIINIFSPEIEKIFCKLDIDVIHVHHPFWMGSKGLQLGKKYHIPVVLTYHTRYERYAHNIPLIGGLCKNIIPHHIVKEFAQKCNAIFAPTDTAKTYLKNLGVNKYIEVLSTGIDCNYYDRIDKATVQQIRDRYAHQEEVLLCSVSRLTKEKNLLFLLQGLQYVKEHTNIPFKCIIAGEGPEKENLLKFVQENQLQDRICFLGSIPPKEICKIYKASELFVFASQSETQGMVLLEAMAGSCPVVAVRSSGVEDVVKNGANGYKTKAEISYWGRRVIEVMENPTLLNELSRNAYGFAQKYSAEVMATKAGMIYYKVMQENRSIHRGEDWESKKGVDMK